MIEGQVSKTDCHIRNNFQAIFHPGTSCLRIQFSTKILSPRRGSGRVGVASGPEKISWEVGNYAYRVQDVGPLGCFCPTYWFRGLKDFFL